MVLQCWKSVCRRKFVWMGHAVVARTTIAMTACYFVSWCVDWDIPAQLVLILPRIVFQRYFASFSLFFFCALAVLNPRVGHTMDVLSPFSSIATLFKTDGQSKMQQIRALQMSMRAFEMILLYCIVLHVPKNVHLFIFWITLSAILTNFNNFWRHVKFWQNLAGKSGKNLTWKSYRLVHLTCQM